MDQSTAKKSSPSSSKLQNLEERQAENEVRFAKIETQVSSLATSVDKLVKAENQSRAETRENFQLLYSKLDAARDKDTEQQKTHWVPIISALVAGSGFVSLMVAPIRTRTHANENLISEINQVIRDNYRNSGAMEGRVERNAEDVAFHRGKLFDLGKRVAKTEGKAD